MSPSPRSPALRAPARRRVRRPALLLGALAALLAASLLAGCQGDLESRLSEIQALQRAGRFGETIEPLRELLDRHPDHAGANYLLGIALVQTGQPGQAAWPLRKAARSDQYRAAASLTLASTLFSSQNYEQAVAALDRGLEKDPDRLALRILRGQALLAAGRPEEALAEAERILEREPDHFRALGLKAGALGDLERFEEAAAAHARVEELAGERQSRDMQARSCALTARFHASREERERADGKYAECLERFPGHGLVLGWASAYYDESGRPGKATELWRDALKRAPDVYAFWKRLANRLEAAGELEEAEAQLEEATTLFDTAQSWLDLAALRRSHGDSAGAREAMEEVLARVGEGASDRLRFQQADVLLDLGELERAEAIAAELEEPTYRKLVRGRLLLTRGRPAEALALLEEALVEWPDNARARYLAARAAEETGDLERAIREYKEAFRADPARTDAALQGARLHLRRGQYRAAAQLALQGAGERPESARESLLLGARALRLNGQLPAARRALERLEEEHPEHRAEARAERAALVLHEEGPAAAVEVLESAGLDLRDPASLPALRALVEALHADGRSDEALRRVAAAVETHPEAPGLRDLHGRLLLRAGRPEAARQAFERALEAEAEHAGALQGLAALAARSGDVEGALSLLERAEEAEPERADVRYSTARLLLRMGRREEGLASLREALRIDPSHARAANDLAWNLAAEGEALDRALTLAARAVRLEPGATTLDTLGYVRLQRGEASRARSRFEEALELRPDSPSIRYRLGVALEKLGETEQALEALRQAVGAGEFPESEAARQEIARLESR